MPEQPTDNPYEYGTYDPALYHHQDDDQAPETEQAPSSPVFDERYKEPFSGLLYLGALTKQFEWLGHRLVVRTLTTDDELAIAQVTQQWDGTNAAERAYIAAVAAMSLVSVDGKEPPTPVGASSSPYGWAYARFNWVKANLYRPTIDKVFSEYLTLESVAEEVVTQLEKSSGSSRTSPDSGTGGSPDSAVGPED